MAKQKRRNKKSEADTEIVDVSKAESFVENNVQNILIGFAGVIALAFIFIFLGNSRRGNETKAETAAIQAQTAFEQSNWDLALNGDETTKGFLAVAEEYPKSHIGNLAHYYSGISYMKLSQYENAIKELKQYKATKDPNINGLAYMNLGDAYAETEQFDQALSHYKKAANSNSDVFHADFLLRYAVAQIETQDFAGAKHSFTEITKNFPNSVQANTAEQYLAGL